MPQATIQGGSATASSVGSAVLAVCESVKKTLFEHARRVEGSPLASARIEDVVAVDVDRAGGGQGELSVVVVVARVKSEPGYQKRPYHSRPAWPAPA